MKRMITLLAAGAMALSPAIVLAGPGGHGGGGGGVDRGATMGQGAGIGRGGAMGQGGMSHGDAMGMGSARGLSGKGPTTSQMGQGSTNGAGWDHMNGPTHETGQPGVECEDGVPPGKASSAPGSAFNEDGTAHSNYAGEQPQNSRNTASVSQYDTGCLRPQR
jgi:hypothetical protein